MTSEVSSSLGKILKSILSNGRSVDAPDYNQAKKEALKIYHVSLIDDFLIHKSKSKPIWYTISFDQITQ